MKVLETHMQKDTETQDNHSWTHSNACPDQIELTIRCAQLNWYGKLKHSAIRAVCATQSHCDYKIKLSSADQSLYERSIFFKPLLS